MDLKLDNRNVIITGGTKGIGRAIAECFAAEGANVSVCARNNAGIETALTSFKKFGKKYTGQVADVKNKQHVEKWIKETASELGGIDILILNASAMSSSWEDSIQVDLSGALYTVQAALPYLRKSSAASITYISSKAASLGIPGVESYCAIKAAVVSYMKSLSLSLTQQGIRVNTVSPGDTYFEGGYWDKIKKQDPGEYKKVETAIGLGRFARPEEIADAVVFVSSPRASFISGANLLVDGGSVRHVVL